MLLHDFNFSNIHCHSTSNQLPINKKNTEFGSLCNYTKKYSTENTKKRIYNLDLSELSTVTVRILLITNSI